MKKLLNLLVLIFLLPSLFFFSLIFVVNSTFLSEGYYTGLIDAKFQDELSRGFTNSIYGFNEDLLKVASKEEFLAEVRDVLSVNALNSTVRDFLVQVNRIRVGEESKLVLPLGIFREILSVTLANLFEKNYDKLPLCRGNNATFMGDPCRVEGANSELVMIKFRNELQRVVVREFGDVVYEPSGVEGKWDLFSVLMFYDQVNIWVYYLVVGFLILLVLVNFRDVKGVVGSFGVVVLLNGVQLLMLYFILNREVSGMNLSENSQFGDVGGIFQKVFLSGPLDQILRVGVVCLSVGLILIVMKKTLFDEKRLNSKL